MGHVENVRRANLLQIVVSSLARCCAALGDVEKFRPPNLLQAVITSDMASERRAWKQSREPLGSCWLSFFSSHRVQIRVFLQWRQARVFFGQFEFTRRFFSTAPVPSAARNHSRVFVHSRLHVEAVSESSSEVPAHVPEYTQIKNNMLAH